MKKTSVITLLFLLVFCCLPKAQVDEKLKNDIRNTGFVHSPLPLDYSKSFETFGLTKKALQSDMLCDMEDMSRWSHEGIGAMAQTDQRSISGRHSLRLTAPVTASELPLWGLGLGTSMAGFDVGGTNWEKYNRIMFYVWFSFKGNAAVHLATGKAAALCGKFLRDSELLDIAEQQLFWIVGKNPFGQSLIYGEGSNYAQQYCALPGEMVGEIPVGMQSRFNEDIPYWPQFNTATYKEVWGASAGKWISLISEF
jgi:hypothetical protein